MSNAATKSPTREIINTLAAEYINALPKNRIVFNKEALNLDEISPGDTVAASIKIKEGDKERLQLFEGVVIAKRNRGIGSSITIRKLSYGTYVERVVPVYSPTLSKLEIIRRGKVRRAKLYYLRDLSGKAARIKEKISNRATDKAS